MQTEPTMDPTEISDFVRGEIMESQNALLDKLDNLVTKKLETFQKDINETQRSMNEEHLSKFEEISCASYKFKKKGNEEQHKMNSKIYQKLNEAESQLKKDDLKQAVSGAQAKITVIGISRGGQGPVSHAENSATGDPSAGKILALPKKQDKIR